MSNLNQYSMSVDMHIGYANVPRFVFTIPVLSLEDHDYDVEVSNQGMKLIHMHSGYTCMYQSVCDDDSGNPNYVFDVYPSGWGSRVSVINRCFNRQYVEASHGHGLCVTQALQVIKRDYVGYVFIWVEYGKGEISYELMPWDFSLNKTMVPIMEDVVPILVHTSNPGFVELGLMAFSAND